MLHVSRGRSTRHCSPTASLHPRLRQHRIPTPALPVCPTAPQACRRTVLPAAPGPSTRRAPHQQQPSRPSTAAHAFDPALLASTAPSPVDAGWFVAAAIGAKLWTKIFDLLVTNGLLEQKLSRKLVHITTGPIFLLTWPLFSSNPWARVFAAAVPALNIVRVLCVGLGITEDRGLVASVSRSGDRGELLKGPLYYAVVLCLTTIFCWREDPTGMVAVCLMCGGDGLADIVGRRWGQGNKLPFNRSKSWAGSLAMLLGGTVMAAGLVTVFCQLGYYQCYKPSVLLPYLLAVSGVATVVEALPINKVLDDNLTVPAVAGGMAMLLMPHAAAAAAPLLATF